MIPASAPRFRDVAFCQVESWTLVRRHYDAVGALPAIDRYFLQSPEWRLRIPTPVGEDLWEGEERTVSMEEVERAYGRTKTRSEP